MSSERGEEAACPLRTASPRPALLAGRYRLERVLGVGGTAVTYEARDLLCEQLDRQAAHLAVKVLSDECSEHPDASLLLYGEYALLRRLRHRHVVQAYGLERDSNSARLFLTMEMVRGPSLQQWIIENPDGARWEAVRAIGSQLLDAVAHCHRQRVVHGDLKPNNVILADDGVRLIDFGLGRVSGGALPAISRVRIAAGTPDYMAPEVEAGDEPSPVSDLYSLACVLSELSGGRLKPSGERTAKMPWATLPSVPKSCLLALLRALAPAPGRRSRDLSQLRAAFGAAKARGRWFWGLGKDVRHG